MKTHEEQKRKREFGIIHACGSLEERIQANDEKHWEAINEAIRKP